MQKHRRGPRIVIAGYFVRFPLGGYVWQALHHMIGFSRLGCEVFFYEGTAYVPHAFDPKTGHMSTEYATGIERIRSIFDRAGLRDAWAFWDAAKNETYGRSSQDLDRILREADLFVNLGGVNRLGERPAPQKRIYVDIDPAFTQIRLENGDRQLRGLLDEHDLFFTYGENIGTSRSLLPTGGIAWRPTRPPVVGDFWQAGPPPDDAPFTTIGKWDATSRDVEFRGEHYLWRKSLEWRKFLALPRASGERFELAMDVDAVPEDHRALTAEGWAVRPPFDVSNDYETYRGFIQRSKGEFTAAKDMNVRLRSGWFSDRSVCYLAAGRPVVLQDTGFGDVVPTGKGLYAVRGLEDAAEAVRAIAADYREQSAAARSIACDHFEATRVLRSMLEAAGF